MCGPFCCCCGTPFACAGQIGVELDQLERQMLEDAAGASSNLDESGMFSIQVRNMPPHKPVPVPAARAGHAAAAVE